MLTIKESSKFCSYLYSGRDLPENWREYSSVLFSTEEVIDNENAISTEVCIAKIFHNEIENIFVVGCNPLGNNDDHLDDSDNNTDTIFFDTLVKNMITSGATYLDEFFEIMVSSLEDFFQNEPEANVFLVGHGVGGTLVEMLSCEERFHFVSAICFESLGICGDHQQKFDQALNPITHLMTAPNIFNTLGKHHGDIYRLHMPHALPESWSHWGDCLYSTGTQVFGLWGTGKLGFGVAKKSFSLASQTSQIAWQGVKSLKKEPMKYTGNVIKKCLIAGVDFTQKNQESKKIMAEVGYRISEKMPLGLNLIESMAKVLAKQAVVGASKIALNTSVFMTKQLAVGTVVLIKDLTTNSFHWVFSHKKELGEKFKQLLEKEWKNLNPDIKRWSVKQHDMRIMNRIIQEDARLTCISGTTSWPNKFSLLASFFRGMIRSSIPFHPATPGLHNIRNPGALLEAKIQQIQGYTSYPLTPTQINMLLNEDVGQHNNENFRQRIEEKDPLQERWWFHRI